LRFGPVLFAAPWNDYTLIGTRHLPYSGSPDQDPIQEEDVQDFVNEINSACPGLHLKMADVCKVVHGFLPMIQPKPGSCTVKLVRDIQIIDNVSEGIEGLMTVIGVRYTLARYIAQKAVNLAVQKLGDEPRPCTTADQPLVGGDFKDYDNLRDAALANKLPNLSSAVIDQLLTDYGSKYPGVLKIAADNPEWAKPLLSGKP
jgi:glycerol-3-phosphate dehydrogenase